MEILWLIFFSLMYYVLSRCLQGGPNASLGELRANCPRLGTVTLQWWKQIFMKKIASFPKYNLQWSLHLMIYITELMVSDCTTFVLGPEHTWKQIIWIIRREKRYKKSTKPRIFHCGTVSKYKIHASKLCSVKHRSTVFGNRSLSYRRAVARFLV